MDYFSILNLNKEPFSNSPDPDYFFHSQQHVGCLQKLELSLRLKRGLNIVIGDVGTGKTTLCRQLIRKLRQDDTIETHLILDPYVSTPHEFLLTVTEMLTAEKPDKSEDDYQLKERIKNALFQKGVDEQKTTVLIIDEGQKIPEFCLELLREFLNYETNDYKLLQIAIFAQKEFENTLEKYANFTDRINLYHRLGPMSFKDTRNMIQFRLNQSSAVAQKLALFTYPAMWAIFRATRGYPRKIVNLCHRSMLAMIIQNKTKANWFLVQSCMKRAFEGTRKRSWALISLVAVLVVTGIVLVPRLIPERTPSIVVVQPNAYGIKTAQDNSVSDSETPKPIGENDSHAGQAQAAKTEMSVASPQDTPPPNKVEPMVEQTISSTTHDQAPMPTTSVDNNNSQSPIPKVTAPQNQRPKVLGQLRVQRRETLGGLIQNIYGIFDLQYLYSVMEMNPHITDPDTIDIGDVIVFPAIPLTIKQQRQSRWWIEMNRSENMKTAFNLLRADPELAATSRLIPFWDKSSGLHFSIVSNRYYYDKSSAENMLNSLSPEIKMDSRLLSVWGDETVFMPTPTWGLESERIKVKEKKRIGEMLIEAGLLNEEQLKQAIVDHKRTNMKLGQYLVREGFVSGSQAADIISKQLKIKKYIPDNYPIDIDLSKALPLDLAQKYQAAPLRKSNFLLTLAMTDPMDIKALDAIEVYTNMEVETVICTYQELNNLIGSLYGSYSGIDGVLEGMQEMQIERDDEGEELRPSMGDVEVSSLQDMAEEAPVVRLVNSILSQAVREGASDVHISPEKDYVQVRFRVDGKLHELPAPPKTMILLIISRLKILANMDIPVSRIPQDGRFTVKMDEKEINIRASTIPTIYGENMVLRLLDTSGGVHSLEELGMSRADIKKLEPMIYKPYGMILSTGPTGSGKSTTLYSILKRINQPDINIITLEDPVEYRINKIRQIQLNRKAGMTFAGGIRSIMRQDPDVIMVGEIRDPETASISVQSALTGHRVLSTVHTNDSSGAITRFIDMGIEPFLVSSVMLVSIAQRLVRKVCPYCKKPYTPPKAALEYWGLDKVESSNFMEGNGCFNCMDKGYKGRTGIYEILIIDELVQDMILNRKSSQEISRAARQSGSLKSLKDDAAKKVLQGITTLEEAASAVIV